VCLPRRLTSPSTALTSSEGISVVMMTSATKANRMAATPA
jgi:hypothetical protein